MPRVIEQIEHHRHTMLLVALVLMCAAQPFMHGSVGGLVIFNGLLTLIVLGVFTIVFKRGTQRVWAVAIALPAIVSRWVAYGLVDDYRLTAVVLHHAFMLAFFGFAVFVILRGVFAEKVIRSDQVVGTVCGYLLAGLFWGNAYVLVDLLLPDSFGVSPRIAWQLDNFHSRQFLYNYFSICTLTGLGYNDVTTIRPLADSLTWMEAVFGQFYLAIVVAELIGLKLAQPAVSQPVPARPAPHERLSRRSRPEDMHVDEGT